MRREEAKHAVIGPAQMRVLRAGIAFVDDADVGNLNPSILLTQPGEPDAVTEFGLRWLAVSLLITIPDGSSVAAAAARVRALPVLVVIGVILVVGMVGLREGNLASEPKGQTR